MRISEVGTEVKVRKVGQIIGIGREACSPISTFSTAGEECKVYLKVKFSGDSEIYYFPEEELEEVVEEGK